MPSPYALDFSPAVQGLNSLADSGYRNQQIGLQQQHLDLAKQETQSQLQTQALEREGQMAKLYGGAAEEALKGDDSSQAGAWHRIISSQPELAAHFQKNGLDVSDYKSGLATLVNEARGYQNPLDVESKRLANEKTRTEIEAGKIFSGQPGAPVFNYQAGKGWVQMGGGDAFADYGPNGEPPGTFQPPDGAPGPQPQAPGQAPARMGTSAPQTPQQSGAAQPQAPQVPNYAGGYAGGLPQAGDPTAMNPGVVSPGQKTFAPYYSPEDVTRLRREERMSPRTAAAAQNTPGALERNAYAKKQGENIASLEERQRAGGQLLPLLDQLEKTAAGADDATLGNAIGPGMGNETAQGIRYMAGAPARFFSGGYVQPYEKSYNLNNQLHHDIEGLVTGFVTAAAKSGITMSDSRQEAFANTIGQMMRATSRAEFNKIAADARHIISQTFGLPAQQPQPAAPGGAPGGQWKYIGPVR